MSFLRKLKFWRKEAGAPLYDKVGYWNGSCPECNEHIGIDVLKSRLDGHVHAWCPCCHTEIYDKIPRATVIFG